MGNSWLGRPLFARLILALFVLALTLVGGIVSAQDAPAGVLRIGLPAPVVLDPSLHTNDPETLLNRAIYDYLVEVLPDSTIGPNLATDWTISDDGLTYTFNLRDDVTFHDGSQFTATDVVFTFDRIREAGSPALNILGDGYTVAADGDFTVVFTLPEVNADFLYGLGAPQSLVLKAGTAEPNVIVEGDNPYVNFNGTGPFILESYEPGAGATLVANDAYWTDGLQLSGLQLVFIDDSVAQVDALLSGQLDFIFKVPIAQVDRLADLQGINVLQRSTSQHPVIRLRTDEGHLGADVRVRQAFKYATDREALNDILLQGRGTVGNNDPIAPVFSFFFDSNIQNQTYDPAMACDLLTEAGMNPVEATLYVPEAFEYADMAALLQQQWAAACINVDIQVRTEGYYYDVSNPDNYFDVDLGITGWGARPSPQILLRQAYIESGIETYFNESRFVDPELEALVAEASQTTDQDARRAIYAQVSQIFLERGPIIVPYFAPLFGATSGRVQGLEMAPFVGLTDLRSVSLSG
ncbi:MAG: ABC transporter substrate-binding protein [Anaerolineae bacterium]|nr:ABC transporter substrate-binding protein [Anaerolineae bacterium]